MNPSSTVDIIQRLGQFLTDYGAWGVCAVLFVLLCLLYYFMSKRHDKQLKEIGGLLEKRNNQLVTLIQKCSTVISNAAATIEDSNEIMKKSQEIMEHTQETNRDMDALISKSNTLIDFCMKNQRDK